MATRRPHILFLLTDQQTRDAIGAVGSPHLHTPHMDRLVEAGTRFERSYCTAPVCTPSRASLVAGAYPHEIGVDYLGEAPPTETPDLGHRLADAGYRVAWAGKWHLPDGYPRSDAVGGFENLPIGVTENDGLGSCTDDLVADEVIRFLAEDHDRPFFLGVSLHNPHEICHWIGRGGPHPRPERCPPLPANHEPPAGEADYVERCRERPHYGGETARTRDWDPDTWRAYLFHYHRLVERVDRQIGRVLDALAAQGLETETLVLLTSDHGEGVAAHRMTVKLMLYEEAASVPFVARYPGVIPAGRVDRESLVSGLDVVSTCCHYAGAEPPAGDGRSLRDALEGRGPVDREALVVELAPDPQDPSALGRALRTARWKSIFFTRGARREMLFDLERDPGETVNRAAEAPEVLRDHRERLGAWARRTRDAFPIPP